MEDGLDFHTVDVLGLGSGGRVISRSNVHSKEDGTFLAVDRKTKPWPFPLRSCSDVTPSSNSSKEGPPDRAGVDSAYDGRSEGCLEVLVSSLSCTSSRLLVVMLKSRTPSIEPWGTPPKTRLLVLHDPPTRTDIVLPVRKAATSLMT